MNAPDTHPQDRAAPRPGQRHSQLSKFTERAIGIARELEDLCNQLPGFFDLDHDDIDKSRVLTRGDIDTCEQVTDLVDELALLCRDLQVADDLAKLTTRAISSEEGQVP